MKMKTILISTDMEGLTGISRWSQVTPTSPEYQTGCAALRHDLRIVLDALSGAGYELVVVDGHWTGTNLKADDVLPARLTSGTRMPWGMVEGVQYPNVVGVILLGYHGHASSGGAMAHTWDTTFTEVRLDGMVCGEIALAAMLSRVHGVPVIGVSGDDFACDEARTICGETVALAQVKRSCSFESVCCDPAADLHLKQMAETALLQIDSRLERDTQPHTISATFTGSKAWEQAALVPGSIRQEALALSFTGTAKDCFDALRVWAMLADH